MVGRVDRKQLRLKVRRRSILDAAATEFARVGFEQATLDSVGALVGLSKAGLYHYVDSKEQLLAALLDEAITAIEQRAAELTPTDARAADRLRAFVTAHVEIGVTTPTGKVLAHHLDLILTSDTTTELRSRHQANLGRILNEGVRTGEFRSLAVGSTHQMVFAALHSIPRWYDPIGPLDIESLMRHVTELFLTGISDSEHRDDQ